MNFVPWANMELLVEDKGQARVVTHDKFPKEAYYLSHFAVFKKHPITKEPVLDRVVFDGRAKYINKSLNDAVFPGPNLANELLSVMLRFRYRF
jgi:hypothetical protein